MCIKSKKGKATHSTESACARHQNNTNQGRRAFIIVLTALPPTLDSPEPSSPSIAIVTCTSWHPHAPLTCSSNMASGRWRWDFVEDSNHPTRGTTGRVYVSGHSHNLPNPVSTITVSPFAQRGHPLMALGTFNSIIQARCPSQPLSLGCNVVAYPG